MTDENMEKEESAENTNLNEEGSKSKLSSSSTLKAETSENNALVEVTAVDAETGEAVKKKRRPRRKRKNLNVKTLFVGGLPMDAKPREIYLMFRKFKGYQGSILKMYGKEGKTATPVAFVTFDTHEHAEIAKSELHGVRFDEQVAKTLKIEFAKTNTKDAANAISSRAAAPHSAPASDEFRVIQPPTVPLGDTATASKTATATPPVHPLPQQQHVAWPPVLTPAMMWDMSGMMYPPPPPTSMTIPAFPQLPPAYHVPHSAPAPSPAPPPAKPAQQTSSFIPNPEVVKNTERSPCTTLFVANLNHNAKEVELKQLFSSIPSFVRVKMHHNKGMKPVVFVQYSQLAHAIEAKTLFSGRSLASAETGGLRIEYAKKDMGELL